MTPPISLRRSRARSFLTSLISQHRCSRSLADEIGIRPLYLAQTVNTHTAPGSAPLSCHAAASIPLLLRLARRTKTANDLMTHRHPSPRLRSSRKMPATRAMRLCRVSRTDSGRHSCHASKHVMRLSARALISWDSSAPYRASMLRIVMVSALWTVMRGIREANGTREVGTPALRKIGGGICGATVRD